MTATEVEQFQEAVIVALQFPIELSLTLLLIVACFLALLLLFDFRLKARD